jgi:hypothetical protein
VEPVRAAILAATGRKPDGLVPQKNWTSAERAFISIPGTVKAITGTKAARNLPHVRDLFLRAEEGGKVGFPVNNVSKCGNIISAAPDRTAAVEAAETATRSVLIRLDPLDDETAFFLGIGDQGSPAALSAGIRDRYSNNDTASGLHLDTSNNNPQSPIPRPQSPFPPDAFQLTPELEAALSALPETRISSPQSLFHFPEFAASALTDYAGRTVAESLKAVRELTGLSLQEITQETAEFSDNKGSFLGKSFWAAFVRGGYQGAVYYIDRLGMKNGDVSVK